MLRSLPLVLLAFCGADLCAADAPLPDSLSPSQPLRPINQEAWVTASDYPTRMVRNEESGDVAFTVEVGENGRVNSCTVTASTAPLYLDEATCQLISRRARFAPATDKNANPLVSNWTAKIRWRLDENPPPLPVQALVK